MLKPRKPRPAQAVTTPSPLLACCFLLLSLAWPADWAGGADGNYVQFQRDVQPILAEHCARCHGADAETREAGLRLDVRASALAGGDSNSPAIVPGKPSESQLIERIRATDDDQRMPPESENKPLTAAQIELLTRWIEQGAEYAQHWAFATPRRIDLPRGDNNTAHPIDALVAVKLLEKGLSPGPPAAAEKLCRRLYLDLVGLPPSPSELDAFLQEGMAVTIDKLLGSQRYGEKWARHWLDVARYSDTNGYEKDLRREQWIWRDWVIRALNDDMPYDQFIIEQVAGDLLPHPSQDQIVAAGFLRNSMLNEEGAIVPEQFRMFAMFDRMDCLGKAVLGLTTQCAQCHSHKFDPLTQDEYYGMFAFLNNTYEAQSWVYDQTQEQQLREVQRELQQLEERVRAARPAWQQELAAWEQSVRQAQPEWVPVKMLELDSVSGLNHPVQLPDDSILMLGHASSDVFFITELDDPAGITGVRLEALTHGDLPFRGPGRSSQGTWSVLEFELFAARPPQLSGGEGQGRAIAAPGEAEPAWEKLALVGATADWSEPEQKRDDGKKSSGPVSFLIDGSDDRWWQADRGRGQRNQSSAAVVRFEHPLDLPRGSKLKFVLRMGDMVGCCRVSVTRSPDPQAAPVAHDALLAMAVSAAERDERQRQAVFDAWRRTLPEDQSLAREFAAAWQRYPAALTSVLHLAEREPQNARQTYLLERGEWDKPLRAITPHTPAFLHPLPVELAASPEPPRLVFARWLASSSSPLTARVAVNRIWQAIFGEGLVETSEDFGTRAAVPEHLELLDSLAVEFMQQGWSQKHLIKTIVGSQTYQQDSRTSPSQLDVDPRNRWLTRGPRFRVEAEVVRDIALSTSGLITFAMGGPSVIPPVPQNVLDYNYTYPTYWTPAEGAERYRRTVYGFRKRSMPDPVMANFDGPNGDTACARRVRSNTPLAALTTLNEAIFVESARALALRVLREAEESDAARMDYAFRLCTSRRPTLAERAELLKLLASRRQKIAEGWLNPREITTGSSATLPTLPQAITPQDAAAWTIVSRVLLNLDETLTKN